MAYASLNGFFQSCIHILSSECARLQLSGRDCAKATLSVAARWFFGLASFRVNGLG